MDIPQELISNLIRVHKLDQPNFEFNRESLLEDLNEEFELALEHYQEIRKVKQKEDLLIYPEFKMSVTHAKVIFDTISSIRLNIIGLPLTIDLWMAFFAKYVVPVRKKYFPEIHNRITELNGKR